MVPLLIVAAAMEHHMVREMARKHRVVQRQYEQNRAMVRMERPRLES
jgi:hypothetical protein